MTSDIAKEDTPELCSICIEPLKNGTAIFTTSCSHSFHFACIKTSFRFKNEECPLCRAKFNSSNAPEFEERRTLPLPTLRSTRQRFHVSDVPIPQEDLIDTAAIQSPFSSVELQVCTTAEFSDVQYDHAKELCVMTSIRSPRPALLSEAGPAPVVARHVPVDLVAVVDRSASMQGAKLELLKQTLRFVVSQLNDNDRFSIVSFDRYAYVVTPLKCMNEDGKLFTNTAISHSSNLQPGRGTNITRGLQLGMLIMVDIIIMVFALYI